MSSDGNGNSTAARRIATLAGHFSSLPPSGTVVAPVDPLVAKSAAGFSAMKQDRRISDVGPSHAPVPTASQEVPLRQVRFSQSSLGSGFSQPAVPKRPEDAPSLAVSLRGANPLSVLTESPGVATPTAKMVRNEDDGTLTTFDHRRLVNTGLHMPNATVKARIEDKAVVDKREWGKYTTKTRGESIAIISPSALNPNDPRRIMGSLSTTHGPDAQLVASTQKALTHMVNRSALLAELTAKQGNPGQAADHQQVVARKREYEQRLSQFSAMHTPPPTGSKAKL